MRGAASQRWVTKDRIEGAKGSFLGAGASVRGYGERNIWSRCVEMIAAISEAGYHAFAADIEVVGLCRKLHAWRIFVSRSCCIFRGMAAVNR